MFVKSRARRARVLILGGGIAGLAAARRLQDGGHEVLVIEGRTRLGGRIETSKELGSPLDLGAAFVHGASELNPLMGLLAQAGVDLVDPGVDGAPLYVDADGRPLTDKEADRVDTLAEQASRKVVRMGKTANAKDSLADGLAAVLPTIKAASETIARGVAHALAAEFEITRGEDASRVALRHLDAEPPFPGGDLMLRQGYGRLIDQLADGVPVVLGAVAEKVSYGDGGVEVFTTKGVFRGERAVITLPLGVLKSRRVRFAPPLPRPHRDAIRRLGVGAVNKVFLRFDEAFWPEDVAVIGRFSGKADLASEFYALPPELGPPTLVWFVKGSHSRRLEKLSDGSLGAAAMKELRATFGESAPEPTAMIRTRWVGDPMSAGSHSILAPGSAPSDHEALSESVAERIFFAGEATTSQFPGTTHGAYLTGLRAAREVLESWG